MSSLDCPTPFTESAFAGMRQTGRTRIIVFGSKGPVSLEGAGGVERGIQRVVPWLLRSGFECVIYARGRKGAWCEHDGLLYRAVRYIDSKNHACWTHSLASFVHYVRHRRPSDIAHIHCIQNAFLCIPLSLLGHRVIFHLHGQEWRATKWGPLMSAFMRASVLPMLLFSVTVVTVCVESKAVLSRWFPRLSRKVIVIPNPVPQVEIKASQVNHTLGRFGLESESYFLYVGRLVRHKRIDLIISALKLLPNPLSLVLAGSPSHSCDYVGVLRRQVRDLKLDERIQFTGHLTWQDLAGLYVGCRATVLMSETEGCSNTILEALGAGCCIICSDLPENRAIAADAALWVPCGNLQVLQTKLSLALEQTVFNEYRDRSRLRRAQLLDDKAVAGRLLRLYQNDCMVFDPYFIVGSGRSGTTVIAACLGQHPELLMIDEPRFLSDILLPAAAGRLGFAEFAHLQQRDGRVDTSLL